MEWCLVVSLSNVYYLDLNTHMVDDNVGERLCEVSVGCVHVLQNGQCHCEAEGTQGKCFHGYHSSQQILGLLLSTCKVAARMYCGKLQ